MRTLLPLFAAALLIGVAGCAKKDETAAPMDQPAPAPAPAEPAPDTTMPPTDPNAPPADTMTPPADQTGTEPTPPPQQ